MNFDEWSNTPAVQSELPDMRGNEGAIWALVEDSWRAAITEAIQIVNSTSVLNDDKRDRFLTIVAELEAILP